MLRSKIDYILKHYAWVQKCYKIIMGFVFRTIGRFIKTEENLVLINSMTGKTFYSSPRAIYDYLQNSSKYDHLRFVWSFIHPEESDLTCEKVKQDSFRYFLTALKAKYWITDVNIERGLRFKKKSTIYMNTWHGVAFNYVGNAVVGRNDYNCDNVDFFCYESDYQKKIFIRDFNVREDNMLPSGLPRNDELYHINKDEIVNLKNQMSLPLNKRIILYAPTWRDSYDKGADYVLAPPINFEKWYKEIGEDYIVLLRTHHFTTKLMNVEFNEFVRDFTSYPRINDLFKVSDVLISDYSACIADYSILERPIICFAYDYYEYKKSRGLYVDFNEIMPNGVMFSEQEVIKKIQTMDYRVECEKTKEMIKDKFTYIGGNATSICVEAMFGR